MEKFQTLCDRLHAEDQIWVRLNDGLKLCLVGVDNVDHQVFVAKFLPCARNARQYFIRYDEIATLEGTERAEEL